MPNILVEQRAVDHVLEKKVFFLARKFFPGEDPPVQRAEKLPVSGPDRETFDQYPIDLTISSRIIIASPIPFKIFNASRPDLHRNPALMKVLYGLRASASAPPGISGPYQGQIKAIFIWFYKSIQSIWSYWSVWSIGQA